MCFLSKVQQLVTGGAGEQTDVKRDVISMFGRLGSLNLMLRSLVRNMEHMVPRSSCIAFQDLKSFTLPDRET